MSWGPFELEGKADVITGGAMGSQMRRELTGSPVLEATAQSHPGQDLPTAPHEAVDSHEYRVRLTGTDAQTALLDSVEDGLPALEVATPPQFGGRERVWSPEHLFVASAAACLMTTFRVIAGISRLEVLSYTDDAIGRLVKGEDRLYRIDRVTLRPRVVIRGPNQIEKAHRLLQKAEEVCLIGRSMACHMVVEPTIEAGE